jgi:hypothetical protein
VLLADPQWRLFEVDEAPLILQQVDGGLLTGRSGDGGDDVIQAVPPQLGLAVVAIGLTAARGALRGRHFG